MDVAALSLSIDSSSVPKATSDLDKFSAASAKAGVASSGYSGSIAKLVAAVQSMDAKMAVIVGSLDRVARANKVASASNDNMAASATRASAAINSLGGTMKATIAASTQAAATIGNVSVGFTGIGRAAQQADAHVLAFRAQAAATVPALQQLGAAQVGVTAAAGAQRAGMQQLSMQLNDVATMYAMGARPAQIFASQIGQVTQAIQLMSGGTSKLAAFLGGPWGMALTTAVIVLGPLIAKLFETKNALDGVGKAAEDAMAKLYASLDRTDAFTDAATDRTKKMVTAMGDLAKANREVASAEASLAALRRTFGAGEAVPAVEGQLSRALKAQADAQKRIDAARSDLDNMRGLRAAEAMQERNRKILETDPTRKAGGSASESSGPSAAEIAAQQAAAIERLGMEELRAKLALAEGAQDRADLSREILSAERAQRVREITVNKDFTAAEKAAQIAYLDRLYGKDAVVDPRTGEMTVTGQPGLLGQTVNRELEQQQARTANDMLQRQVATLGAWAQIEPNTRERARMESNALELSQQIERNLLEQERATMTIAEFEKADAALKSQQAAARARLGQQNASPMERYVAEAQNTATNINDAMESVQIRGLESLNNGLTDAIMGVRSLGSVFKDVARQIIADLIKIAIRQMIVNTLMKAFGGGGGIGGMLGGLFADGGAFGTAQKFATGGAFEGAQRFANGGAFTNQVIASPTLFRFAKGSKFGLMGEEGPEAVMPLVRGANGKLGVHASGGGGTRVSPSVTINTPITITQSGSFTTQDAQGMAAQAGQAAVAEVRRNLDAYLREWDTDGAVTG